MTWVEFMSARHLLAEETVGTALRIAKAQEDAAARKAARMVNGTR